MVEAEPTITSEYGSPALLEELSPKARAALLSRGSVSFYHDGTCIFSRGETGHFKTIVSGAARLEVVDISGRTVELVVVGPGQMIGETASLTGIPHIHDAVAVGNTRVHHIATPELDAL